MEANIVAIKKLIKNRFDNNITSFSDSIGVSRSLVSQIINGSTEPKDKFFCSIIKYCDKNELDFKKYIFLN
ncbi:helix-turn-helix domain-containing protein [Orenia marismortui]|uniref:helix-turn-helix domain-containing protein n=1 Tax=Orenia marismortui TaxID=46469 RepID=UPI00036D0E74|nr:helix-turn-helix transcriptional regulator [Orenia marismortui]